MVAHKHSQLCHVLVHVATAGVRWMKSFCPWNSKTVTWIRKCHRLRVLSSKRVNYSLKSILQQFIPALITTKRTLNGSSTFIPAVATTIFSLYSFTYFKIVLPFSFFLSFFQKSRFLIYHWWKIHTGAHIFNPVIIDSSEAGTGHVVEQKAPCRFHVKYPSNHCLQLVSTNHKLHTTCNRNCNFLKKVPL